MSKSHDQKLDKIRNFQDARFVFPLRALWKLYRLKGTDRSLLIVQFGVPLDHNNNLYYGEGQDTQAAVRSRAGTNLTECFKCIRKMRVIVIFNMLTFHSILLGEQHDGLESKASIFVI